MCPNPTFLNSIRARMTASFALFIAILMLLICVAFYVGTKRAARQNADVLLRQAAQEIRQDLAGVERDKRSTPEFLQELQDNRAREGRDRESRIKESRSGGVATLVVDASGRVIAHSPPPLPQWPLRGDDWRTTTISAKKYSVVLALPWEKTERELRARTVFLLLLSVLVVAATAGGAWVLVGRTLSPIDGLVRQARAASVENLRVQLEAPSPDAEIVRLVATLNDLLSRWSETAQSRERFYAAAAHELRTPLQALGGHLEVALSRTRSAPEYEVALRESHAQTERLTSLVQDLLLLNQLDAGARRSAAVEFDLADVCESELRPLRALAQERDVKIELEMPGRCTLTAPWNHATMLLRNLLENAVKYADAGSTVRIALNAQTAITQMHRVLEATHTANAETPNAETPNAQTLTICNDCAWDESVEIEQLFEPFFRPDASRTSATGGNGLGLAICRSICRSNGWQISLRRENNALCATVVFAAS